MELNGAHALVTGASKGIGAAIAHALAEAGATVSMVARSGDVLERMAKELDGHHLAADLTDDEHVDGLVDRIEAQAGRPVDVLVNNAGVEASALLEDTDETDIERVIVLDLVAPMRLTRQVLPGMIERGRGHIVQLSSQSAVSPVPGLAVYGAAKAGLSHASAALRMELKGTGVGLTVCTLGPVATDMWDRVEVNPYSGPLVRRGERLGLTGVVRPELVAADVADAIVRGRRHVRHPKRSVPTYVIPEVPRRLVEVLGVGLTPRDPT